MTAPSGDGRTPLTPPAHLSQVVDALERRIVHLDDLSVPDHGDLGPADDATTVPGSPEPPD
ncbi:MAG: hypothetical protein JWN22_1766 [Nocardioides sp.]|jgi:hypothetical protein|nr:hypothetical protein [Nocardioides sp.]